MLARQIKELIKSQKYLHPLVKALLRGDSHIILNDKDGKPVKLKIYYNI